MTHKIDKQTKTDQTALQAGCQFYLFSVSSMDISDGLSDPSHRPPQLSHQTSVTSNPGAGARAASRALREMFPSAAAARRPRSLVIQLPGLPARPGVARPRGQVTFSMIYVFIVFNNI